MAINKKLIHFKKHSDFIGKNGTNGTTSPTNGCYSNIPANAIVFILDTKQIWTHGQYYNCPYTQDEITALLNNKADTSDLDNYLTTKAAESLATKAELTLGLNGKVNAVTGKGLSTNDYTTVEKNKLYGIAEGAEVNVQSDWNVTDTNSDAYIKNKPSLAEVATSGSYNSLTNKPTIDAALSTTSTNAVQNKAITEGINAKYTKPNTGIPKDHLASDVLTLLGKANTALLSIPSEYITETELNNKGYATTVSVNTSLSEKVDKADGKGLSTNDFTNDYKTKLDNIATGANKYTLPSAGSSLGGVKSGGDVTISEGIITVNDDSHNHVISNIDGLQDALNNKAATSHASTATTYGVGTTANYGHVKISNGDADTVGTADGLAAGMDHTHSLLAPKASPTFTGTPKAPTAAKGTNTTQVATTAFVQEALPTALKNPNALKFGTKSYDGSSELTITAADLGLSSALKYHGTTTTALTDGATTKPIVIGGSNHNQEQGCVVAYNNSSFVWDGSKWEELGNPGNYKVVQSAVSSPSASGNATAFIDTISLDANGKITATKKNILTASTSVYGITKLSSATNSTSEDIAATPKAVKTAYDLANSKWTYNADTIKAIKVNKAGTADIANSVNWINVNNKPINLSQFNDDVVAGKYLPLSGGSMNGNVVWKVGTGDNSILPGHIYRNLHSSTGDVYDHYCPISVSSTNTFANLRVFSSSNAYRTLRFGGDGTFTWDGNTIIHSGNIGSQSVNYATSAGNATNALNTKRLVYNYTSPNVSLGMGEIAYSLVSERDAGNLPVKYNANGVLTLNTHQGNYYYQLGFSSNGNIYGRFSEGYELSDSIKWKQIAFTDSNVASATRARYIETQMPNSDDWYVDRYRAYTRWSSDNNNILDWRTEGDYPVRVDIAKKLNTARTIWGQSFDGTGNVMGDIYLSTSVNDGNALSSKIVFTGYSGFFYGPIIGTVKTADDGWGRKDLVFLQHNSRSWPSDTSSHIEVMRINSSGNVGIGTTSPIAKLHVVSSNSNGVIVQDSGRAEASILYRGSDAKYWIVGKGVGNTGDSFAVMNASGKIPFFINSEGNVGIGTTDPLAKLHVYGGATPIMCESNASESSIYFVGAGENSAYKWAIGKGVWGIEGKFGIGEYNTAKKLFVQIDTNGHVGIGVPTNNSPSEKLHVNGNVKVENGNFIGNLTGTASNAAAVNGTKIAIVSKMPSSPDSSTLYFVK